MKRLFAVSITLGVLMFPAISASGGAQAQVGVGTTVVPGQTVTVVEQPVVFVDGVPTLVPVAMPVVTSPVVIPYGEDGLPLGVSAGGGVPMVQPVGQPVGVQFEQPVTTQQPVIIEQPATAPMVTPGPVETPAVAPAAQPMVTDPMALPGEHMVSGSTGAVLPTDAVMTGEHFVVWDGQQYTTPAQEIPVGFPAGANCTVAACPVTIQDTPPLGVSADTIERRTALSVDRLTHMPNDGVMVTYSTGFLPDEVLTINPQNQPTLMTVDVDGNLSPHPTRSALYHEGQIIILDNSINLADLADNPFPVSTFTEVKILPGFEREVALATPGLTHFPITQQSFNNSLPITLAVGYGADQQVVVYDELGQPQLIDVGMPVEGMVFEGPQEQLVAFSSALPVGWRALVMGQSMLILDERGVIRDIVNVQP